MAKYLVIFTDSLDDIEINGFTVMTEKELDSFEETAMSITWPFVYQIGQDELEFSSGDDFFSRIETKEISNDEIKTLKRLFNNDFGVFIDEAFLQEVIGDEDDLDDDDSDEDNEDDDYGYDDSY